MFANNRNKLTEGQKAVIQDRHNAGQKLREIEHGTGIRRSTIKSFLARVKKRGSDEDLPRAGRPRKTTIRADRRVIRKAPGQTRVLLAQLAFLSDSNLSVSTIRRRLQEVHIQKWRAAKRPRLNTRHVAKRLQWAKEHRQWQVEDWEKVGWSDECSVEKGADPRQVWVFRRPRELEKFKPQNVLCKDKSGSVSLMVWGCFAGAHQGPLVSFRGVNTAVTYVTALRENLLPFIESMPRDIKHNFIFQQDNAAIHTAKVTKAWFEEQAFKVMEWPPNSPDMNPIEHMWRVLKAALHKRFPDTSTLRGGPEKVREVLEQRLKVVWQDIGADVLTNLVESMPRRVAVLYAAKGWYTSY
jgi:transposase